MAANGTQLKHFGFLVDHDEFMFTPIKAAQPVASISCLEVYCANAVDPLTIRDPLIDLSHSLLYLTHLTVKSSLPNSPMLLIDILQTVTRLKSLQFAGLAVQEDVAITDAQPTMEIAIDDSLSRKILGTQVVVGKLESICLPEFVMDFGESIMEKVNLLAFILRSCPNLNNFDLIASVIGATVKINLDFR